MDIINISQSMKENPLCKTEPKYSYLWYHNKCDKFLGAWAF